MSANVETKPNMYDTYPNMYSQPSIFQPASNDLAGNRGLLESNLVGGGVRRRRRRTAASKRNGKQNKSRSRKTRSKRAFHRCN